ncbi:ankyrin repeat domain-containing protein [Legionella sp.]|nr:ankyrin repeat domain-containing protein [Legionella sp.]
MPELDKVKLPSYSTFHAPAFTDNPVHPGDLEFWMLYSPAKGNIQSKALLDKFYKKWLQSEDYHREYGEDAIYYDLAAAIMPIWKIFRQGGMELWVVPNLESNSIKVKELGLIKYYSNTHKYQSRKLYNPSLFIHKQGKGRVMHELFLAAQSPDTTWLKSLIEYGADVNMRIRKTTPYSYKHETALHIAVSRGNVPAAILLLEAGANPDLLAIYPGGIKKTARDLMYDKPEFSEVLKGINVTSPSDVVEKEDEIVPTQVLEFRQAFENNWEYALDLLKVIPNTKLTSFLRLANLDVEKGNKLVDFAFENNKSDLIISLAQINGEYFSNESSEYLSSLLQGIYLLKDYKLLYVPFLREAIIKNPAHSRELVSRTLFLQREAVLSNDVINKVLIEHSELALQLLNTLMTLKINNLFQDDFLKAVLTHPEHSTRICKSIIKWQIGNLEEQDYFRQLILTNLSLIEDNFKQLNALEQQGLLARWLEKDVRDAIIKYPEQATNLASIIIKLANAQKLDVLPLLIHGSNLDERLYIGNLLLECKLLDRIAEIDEYQLLDPDNTERLIEALDCTRMKSLAAEEEFKDDLESEFEDQEDFEQLIQSFSEKKPFTLE